jgi:hypothetical protein
MADIKRRKLEWLRYVIRMDQIRLAMTIFESEREGRKSEMAGRCTE